MNLERNKNILKKIKMEYCPAGYKYQATAIVMANIVNILSILRTIHVNGSIYNYKNYKNSVIFHVVHSY